MISFHLVYIGDTYPNAKAFVYTFHMPVFLLVSGYLTDTEKPIGKFLHRMLWLAVPYIIMESGYIVMASLLPIREHIDNLTAGVFLEKLFLHPLGPYWFLHTLILGSMTLHAAMRLPCINTLSRLIVCGLAFALYSYLGIASLAMLLYFMAGFVIRCSGLSFTKVIRPSWLSLIPIVILAATESNLHPHTAGGILIVYLVVSLCLAAYPYIRGRLRQGMLFLGKNTLPLFLFSPMFTILCKPLQPMLAFEPTGMLFLAVSLIICITGGLLVALCMDTMHISPVFFGRRRIIVE